MAFFNQEGQESLLDMTSRRYAGRGDPTCDWAGESDMTSRGDAGRGDPTCDWAGRESNLDVTSHGDAGRGDLTCDWVGESDLEDVRVGVSSSARLSSSKSENSDCVVDGMKLTPDGASEIS